MYTLPSPEPTKALKAIAVLTSGGDAPGMNPAIRGVVRTALNHGIRVYGINRGYSGLIIGDLWEMSSPSVTNIIQRGGTLLKSARCEAFKDPAVRKQAAQILTEHGIDGLVVIGGDGSLTGAALLHKEWGIPVVGLPGTIDNDIYGTEDCIGFDTAVNTALEAIDRIRDTALSHERLFLVEVMGRNSGFIATQVGIACGAEMVVIPEVEFKLDTLCFQLASKRMRGEGASGIIVVAEGQRPGLTYRLAQQLEAHNQDPRVCILGHIQRGGSPTGHDRVLASCMGATAVDYLRAGFANIMVGVQKGTLAAVPLQDVIDHKKKLSPAWIQMTEMLHR